jgi:hypothetical protein
VPAVRRPWRVAHLMIWRLHGTFHTLRVHVSYSALGVQRIAASAWKECPDCVSGINQAHVSNHRTGLCDNGSTLK